MIEEELRKYVGGKYSPRELKIAINFYMRVLHIKVAMMLGNLKCKLGFHKPAQWRHTYKHKCRTTNKGREIMMLIDWYLDNELGEKYKTISFDSHAREGKKVVLKYIDKEDEKDKDG